ncbi:hypothetical protein E2C01_081736 [Portunus trituberculatus]|uniref:Uncharacterized protein n=1 Tax=Portunus trituberculatus TaxID=210409 RepID=A0A5B7J1X6_PORTR|nr:hypothetical protein [Portunus trituberculatus]
MGCEMRRHALSSSPRGSDQTHLIAQHRDSLHTRKSSSRQSPGELRLDRAIARLRVSAGCADHLRQRSLLTR